MEPDDSIYREKQRDVRDNAVHSLHDHWNGPAHKRRQENI